MSLKYIRETLMFHYLDLDTYKKGYVQYKGKKYLIEFIDVYASSIRFPYVFISEVNIAPVKKHFYSRKTEFQEVETPINHFCTDENRYGAALCKLLKYVKDKEWVENAKQQEAEDIEKFCNSGVVDLD